MRGVYKKEGFPNIQGGPRFQVENAVRLQQGFRREENQQALLYGCYREPQGIRSQEGERYNWESYKVVDWGC